MFPLISQGRVALKDIRRLTKVGLLYAPFTVRPEQIQIDITDRCNYKCPTCSKWHEKSAEGELTTQEWKTFLTQASPLPFSRRVVFAGGEPLLRSDTIELVRHATALNLNSVLVTNGSILNKTKLLKLQKARLDYLMVSLNALDPAIHDATRGVDGSFESIVQLLDLYASLRETMKLGIATIIMGSNLDHILKLVDFVKEHNLHGIIFQTYTDDLIHRPFRWKEGLFRDNDWYEQDPYVMTNYEQLDEIIDELLHRQRYGAPILNGPMQLKAMKDYFRDPQQYHKIQCTAGITSFLVDAYGDVRLCFDFEPVGNIRHQKPLEIWRSSDAGKVRKCIVQCQHSCRIMNHIY